MSGQMLPPRRQSAEEMALPSSPSNGTRLCGVFCFADSSCSRNDPSVPDTSKQSGCAVPTMVLSEARGLSLFLVVRGGIGFLERLGAGSTQPNGLKDTHPRTRASGEPTGHRPK